MAEPPGEPVRNAPATPHLHRRQYVQYPPPTPHPARHHHAEAGPAQPQHPQTFTPQRNEILGMFPLVDPAWVTGRVRAGWSVVQIADFVASPRNRRRVPFRPGKKPPPAAPAADEQPAPQAKRPKITNYFEEYGDFPSGEYKNSVEGVLSNDFVQISLPDVRKVLQSFNLHYAPSWRALKQACDRVELGRVPHISVTVPFDNATKEIKCKVLKRYRTVGNRAVENLAADLRTEVEWVRADGHEQMLECPVCCQDVPANSAVQCRDGHVFCVTCICGHAKEAAYGQAAGALVSCLDPSCDYGFQNAVLKDVVEDEVLERLEQRRMEEDINAADISNLERCKYCGWGAVVVVPAEEDKVFRCQNPACETEVCRVCGKDWDENHIGVPCKELETDAATAARKQYEEKMTSCVIRYCHRCRLPFDKAEGCNKMRCRCGATMCYVCRAPDINYDHFCRHPKTPEQARCNLCNACMLWEPAHVKDVERARQIREEALNDARLAENRRDIGGDSPPPLPPPPAPAPIRQDARPLPHPLAAMRPGFQIRLRLPVPDGR